MVPRKDGAFSNLSTNGLITACNVATRSLVAATEEVQRIQTDVVTLTEQAGVVGNYTLTPNASKTIYRFNAPLSQNSTINFSVNTSHSQVGDEMVWFMVNSIQPLQNMTINLGLNLLLEKCGNLSSNIQLYGGNPSRRLAQYWIFDGTFWLYTGDNC